MNLRSVDLNLLPVFDAVYTEASLTRAGELLGMTQPAVSNALARLRAVFNDPLFVRSGRAMTPTPAAENLAGPIRHALRELQVCLDHGARFDAQTSEKTFHIATRDAAASILMPNLMRRVRMAAPTVKIHCHQIERYEILIELAAGKLDFAVDIPQLARSDLNNAELFEDRYVCVMRKSHTKARGKLSLEAFLALDHVTISGRRQGRSFVDIALSQLGRHVNMVLRVPHFQPAFHVVMSTDLVLSAPLSLARQYDVVTRELPFPAPPLGSRLYWHKNADLDPANRWMRAHIIAAAR